LAGAATTVAEAAHADEHAEFEALSVVDAHQDAVGMPVDDEPEAGGLLTAHEPHPCDTQFGDSIDEPGADVPKADEPKADVDGDETLAEGRDVEAPIAEEPPLAATEVEASAGDADVARATLGQAAAAADIEEPMAEKPQAEAGSKKRMPWSVRKAIICAKYEAETPAEVADAQLGATQVDADTQAPPPSPAVQPDVSAADRRGCKRIRSPWDIDSWVVENAELASTIPKDLYPVQQPGKLSWTVPSAIVDGLRIEVLLKQKALVVKGVADDVPFLANTSGRRNVGWNHKGDLDETWRWLKDEVSW
jgi:hypothetical protein